MPTYTSKHETLSPASMLGQCDRPWSVGCCVSLCYADPALKQQLAKLLQSLWKQLDLIVSFQSRLPERKLRSNCHQISANSSEHSLPSVSSCHCLALDGTVGSTRRRGVGWLISQLSVVCNSVYRYRQDDGNIDSQKHSLNTYLWSK